MSWFLNWNTLQWIASIKKQHWCNIRYAIEKLKAIAKAHTQVCNASQVKAPVELDLQQSLEGIESQPTSFPVDKTPAKKPFLEMGRRYIEEQKSAQKRTAEKSMSKHTPRTSPPESDSQPNINADVPKNKNVLKSDQETTHKSAVETANHLASNDLPSDRQNTFSSQLDQAADKVLEQTVDPDPHASKMTLEKSESLSNVGKKSIMGLQEGQTHAASMSNIEAPLVNAPQETQLFTASQEVQNVDLQKTSLDACPQQQLSESCPRNDKGDKLIEHDIVGEKSEKKYHTNNSSSHPSEHLPARKKEDKLPQRPSEDLEVTPENFTFFYIVSSPTAYYYHFFIIIYIVTDIFTLL